jgi:ankyrin repeat protein
MTETTDEDGKTPLFYADLETTRLLIQAGAKLNVIDTLGKTALDNAEPEKKRLLIATGANM